MDLPRRTDGFHHMSGHYTAGYDAMHHANPREHLIKREEARKPTKFVHHAINVFTVMVILGGIYYLTKSKA